MNKAKLYLRLELWIFCLTSMFFYEQIYVKKGPAKMNYPFKHAKSSNILRASLHPMVFSQLANIYYIILYYIILY